MPEPKQARSRETQGRIVAAALELVAERGREGPSVPEIAERAGVSIGAFYGRFPTKEALFEHVDRQLFEESARCWVAFLAPENWRGRHAAEIVREVVRGWVDAVANHHPLNRALTERWRSAPSTPAVRAAATAHYEAIFDALGTLLEERREEVSHPDPRLGAKMLIEVIDAVLVERLTFSDTFLVPHKLSRAALVDELTALGTGYLGLAVARPRTATIPRPPLRVPALNR
jgi:AcrR family transcriptional regulator